MRLVLGRKAVSGKVLTLVISLVIAIVALILLWSFLQDAMPFLTTAVENAIDGFKALICEKMPIFNWPIIGDLLGC